MINCSIWRNFVTRIKLKQKVDKKSFTRPRIFAKIFVCALTCPIYQSTLPIAQQIDLNRQMDATNPAS